MLTEQRVRNFRGHDHDACRPTHEPDARQDDTRQDDATEADPDQADTFAPLAPLTPAAERLRRRRWAYLGRF